MDRPTLLLVDAHDGSRRAHAALLQEIGYDVLEAHNGVQALAAVRERRPALVILDLWPFFSASLQMLERLRQHEATARIPALVVTTPVAPSYRERALAAGCADFLEKPCAADEILERVRSLVALPVH